MAGVQKQGGMKMKFENCKEYCSLKNNKENIRKLMKEFDCEASGKCTPGTEELLQICENVSVSCDKNVFIGFFPIRIPDG